MDAVVDLADPAQLGAVQLPETDCLVHCAGVIDEDFKTDPTVAYRRATYGAEALAQTAAKAGCKRFIYLSSTHVYGAQAGTLTEAVPANPQTHYALAHFCTEQLFRRQALTSQGACVALRPNAVFGLPAHPGSFQRWSLIPFSFPLEAKEQGRITLKSSGLQRRNFVSIAAIADIVHRCIDGDLTNVTGVINVLGTQTESVYEFAQRCRRIAEVRLGRPCVVERANTYLESPNAGAGSDFTLVSRFVQTRPAGELDDFISRFIALC